MKNRKLTLFKLLLYIVGPEFLQNIVMLEMFYISNFSNPDLYCDSCKSF